MKPGKSPKGRRSALPKLAQAAVRASTGTARSAFPFNARWRLPRDCCVASRWTEARETNVSIARLTEWRDRALAGAAAALHPGNRDRPAGAQRRNLAADKVEVAHAIEVGIVCDAGRAIAGAELGAKIEPDLGAAIGRLAGKCATGSPLIDREWPLHLGPGRAGRRVCRPPPCPRGSGGRARNIRRARRRAPPPAPGPIPRASSRVSLRPRSVQRALFSTNARACAICGLTGSAFSVSATAAA